MKAAVLPQLCDKIVALEVSYTRNGVGRVVSIAGFWYGEGFTAS